MNIQIKYLGARKNCFRGDNLKKYICPNCGFVNRFRTKKISIDDKRHKHICKNCKADVYKSRVVLQSIMRMDVLKNKR